MHNKVEVMIRRGEPEGIPSDIVQSFEWILPAFGIAIVVLTAVEIFCLLVRG